MTTKDAFLEANCADLECVNFKAKNLQFQLNRMCIVHGL